MDGQLYEYKHAALIILIIVIPANKYMSRVLFRQIIPYCRERMCTHYHNVKRETLATFVIGRANEAFNLHSQHACIRIL